MNRDLSLKNCAAAPTICAAFLALAACSGSSAAASSGTTQNVAPAAAGTPGPGSLSGSGATSTVGAAPSSGTTTAGNSSSGSGTTSMSGSSSGSSTASKSGSSPSAGTTSSSGASAGSGPNTASGSSPSAGTASKSGASAGSGPTTSSGSSSSAPVKVPSASLSGTSSTQLSVPQSLSADTNRPNISTFVLGEDVEVTFQATGLPASKATSLAVKVVDEFGNEISSTSLSMTADSTGKASATFSAPASKFGYYRVNATLASGHVISNLGTRPLGFISYAVVLDPAKRTNYGDALTRFGMQGGIDGQSGVNGQGGVTGALGSVISYLGARYLLAGPGWRDLEPNYPGQFAQARITAVAQGQTHPALAADNSGAWATYAIPLVTQASVPGWAMEPGTGTIAWPDMGVLNTTGAQGMAGFAKARAQEVAADYAGQSSHYYQVTWEPEVPGGWAGTPAQLIQFFQQSYAAIHQGDPKAIVMGPTMLPGDTVPMAQLWAAGLAPYLDAVSMHPYAQWPPETNGLVSDIRTQMKMAQDAKGHSLPFVGTEHGLTSGSITALNQALGNIRTTLILLGEGFKFDVAFYIADFWEHSPIETNNTFGYYWNLDPNLPYGTDKMGPKPAAPAFAAMTYLLDGTTSSGPLSNLSGTQMGYRFERNGTAILALWDYQAAASTLTLPVPSESVEICNWMGNCFSTASVTSILLSLRSAPIYIIGRGL